MLNFHFLQIELSRFIKVYSRHEANIFMTILNFTRTYPATLFEQNFHKWPFSMKKLAKIHHAIFDISKYLFIRFFLVHFAIIKNSEGKCQLCNFRRFWTIQMAWISLFQGVGFEIIFWQFRSRNVRNSCYDFWCSWPSFGKIFAMLNF